jgi:glycolate oxidase FAD binding subunit
MSETAVPAAEWELEGLIARAAEAGMGVSARGGDTKADVGHTVPADLIINMTSLRGIEAVDRQARRVTARAGTQLRAFETDLLRHGLMLAFEPPDFGPLFGREPWRGTIAGAFASNWGGSRSLVAGPPSRSLVSATLINGEAQTVGVGPGTETAFGPQLLPAMAGNWGCFGVFTRFEFSVVPLPEETVSLTIEGLAPELAVEAMAEAIRRDGGITGALHLDRGLVPRLWAERLYNTDDPLTVVRLEGRTRDLPERVQRLRETLGVYGRLSLLPDTESTEFWAEIQSLSVFQNSSAPLWRIVLPPAGAARFLDGIFACADCTAMLDCGGRVVWLEAFDAPDAAASDVRRLLAEHGGAATLVRADAETRGRVGSFHPMDRASERLLRELKQTFDPQGIFNRGRVYDGF